MKQDYLQIKVLEVAPRVYAAGPLFESDLELMAGQRVRSIVNTRPDGETDGQPSSVDLAEAAEKFGINLVHFPVDAMPVTREAALAFARICDELERPLVVCGRSGGVSARIWETAESL